MPHNYDYATLAIGESVSDTDVTEDAQLADLGPDSDEVWDVLDVYIQSALSYNGSATDMSSAYAWQQLHTGDSLLVGSGSDGTVTPGGNTQYQEQSDRIIRGWQLEALQPVEDESSGTGAGGLGAEYQEHLRFGEGDLRIEYPGTIDLGLAAETSGNTANVKTTVSVHYLSESRHR
jgi:hypothetical protein